MYCKISNMNRERGEWQTLGQRLRRPSNIGASSRPCETGRDSWPLTYCTESESELSLFWIIKITK